jgi:type I restriction-modification system DNA methylase subunit
MPIFQKSVVQDYVEKLDQDKVEKAYQTFRTNYNSAKIEQIKTLKEEEYQDGFLRDIFVDVFGYALRPEENYNLQREFKNQTDGKKADGAIIKDDNAIAVIELKSTSTKDLTKVTQQAFNYKNNQPECKYVITSNFQKLRFYIDYSNEFEEFDLFFLDRERFEVLYLILQKDNIFTNLPTELKTQTLFHEKKVSEDLYSDYSHFKQKLFLNLVANHPDDDKLLLFKKSQKLLDRFLFILFAEDSGLLPTNSISRVIERFDALKEHDAYKPLYEIFGQYFGYMNIGRPGKTPSDEIPAYNGGLFYEDLLLNSLTIDDDVLIEDLQKLSKFDFNTEVDVNILGHIFEHSLNEIENVTAEIEGTVSDQKRTKRKKDGVFYTPKYITTYIVANTIGTLCIEKRKELDIEEIEFDASIQNKDGKLSKKGQKLFKKLEHYKKWLIGLKIIDPACGSGAFLNQALIFLIEEHEKIDDIIAELTSSPLRLFDTDKNILENNLFGVDINEESVEIAQLSLWLRTARKGRKLSKLNNNIKCGNSLRTDEFDWSKEFPDIMKNGGFDVVIGNPPYIKEYTNRQAFNGLHEHYCYQGKMDLWYFFGALALEIVKKDSGLIGYIAPNNWITNSGASKFRNIILNDGKITQFIDFGDFKVFDSAGIQTMIYIMKRSDNNANYTFDYSKVLKTSALSTKAHSCFWSI